MSPIAGRHAPNLPKCDHIALLAAFPLAVHTSNDVPKRQQSDYEHIRDRYRRHERQNLDERRRGEAEIPFWQIERMRADHR